MEPPRVKQEKKQNCSQQQCNLVNSFYARLNFHTVLQRKYFILASVSYKFFVTCYYLFLFDYLLTSYVSKFVKIPIHLSSNLKLQTTHEKSSFVDITWCFHQPSDIYWQISILHKSRKQLMFLIPFGGSYRILKCMLQAIGICHKCMIYILGP